MSGVLIIGDAGDNTLIGGAGNDTLVGLGGADVMDGGPGNDIFSYFDPTVTPSAPGTPDLILNFQGAGAAGGDRILLPSTLLAGRALAFSLAPVDFHFAGYGGSGVQLPAAMIGDGFADVVWNFTTSDPVFQFTIWIDLNDNGRFDPTDIVIRIARAPGETGTALIATDFAGDFAAWFGGPGADFIAGTGAQDDVIRGMGGNDTLSGGDGSDMLYGGPGDDSLSGGALGDWLEGGPGSDTLDGGDGPDTMFAADPLTPETESTSARNLLRGGAGDDQMFGGVGRDTMEGGPGDDLLWAEAGDDSLDGGDGNDRIFGGDGQDWLNGGPGDDQLFPGMGQDTVWGGSGADTMAFEIALPGSPSSRGDAPSVLMDFDPTEGDRIFLGAVNGLVTGPLGPALLLWRGSLAVRDMAVGLPVGTALGGEDIGPGYHQTWWIPVTSGGIAAGGWLVVDLDQDFAVSAGDFVLRVGSLAYPATLTEAAFTANTFRARVGTQGADTIIAGAVGGQQIFGIGGADLLIGGASADRLVGGEGADTLLGNGGADQLWGGAGDDVLEGGDGDDELFAEGPGFGEVDGFLGRNTLRGGAGNDSLYGSDGREVMEGGAGNDRLYGLGGSDSLMGGEGDDYLIGGDGADTLDGGPGVDTLEGGPGDDVIFYDPFDAFIDGGDGIDMLVITTPVSIQLDLAGDQVVGGGIAIGFEGVDASRVQQGVSITGSVGRNRIIGSGFDDRIAGLDGDDSLWGGSGNDTLLGGAGDDVLDGGAGADLLDGGSGNDTVSYLAAPGGVAVYLYSPGGWLGDAVGDTLIGVEALRGSLFNDFLGGDDLPNRIEGLDGNDVLDGRGGDDTLDGGDGDDLIMGGAGQDWLVGGAGADTLDGGDGDDILDGGAGADSMVGGAGNDFYFVDTAADRVVELAGGGSDTIASWVSLYLPAQVEALILANGAGNLFGVGNDAANVLRGNDGENLLIGWGGNDTIWGGAARDALFGMDGDDFIFGEDGVDYMVGGNGHDFLDGGNGPDEMYGEAGNDTLLGGTDFATDILVGGSGDDWIDGGPAWDLMYGGPGNDTFVVSQQVDWVFELPGEGHDLVIARSPNGFYLYANIEDLLLEGTTPFGVGNALDNRITGNAIGNWLLGGAGNDTLDGAGGNDVQFGQDGADHFIIRAGHGSDIIGDFEPGADLLHLYGYAGVQDFAALSTRARQVGTDLAFDLAPGEILILQGLSLAMLSPTDILFQP